MSNLKRLFYKLSEYFTPVLIIFFIVNIFFWKVWVNNEVPIPGDFTVGVYYPWLDHDWGYPTGVPVKNPITADVVSFTYQMRTLAVNTLKNSQLPLWNKYILTGTPLLGNFQSAPYSPTNIFYFVFDTLTAWSMQVIVQHFLLAIFMYLLIRNWKLSVESAIVGGIIYAFSGFNLIWSQWNAHALAASFIPLFILCIDKWFKSNKKIYLIIFSLSIAGQMLAGYPQVAIYSIFAMFIYWALVVPRSSKGYYDTAIMGVYGLLGFGLAAFQLLPGAELLNYSQRAAEIYPYKWSFLPWDKLITFIAPDFFGNHSTQNYWGPQDYTSNTGFVGVVSFLLALISVHLFKKHSQIKYGVYLALFALFISLPSPLSVYLWNSGFLALNAAAAHRGLVLWNFAIAILAAWGFDSIFKSKIKLNQKLITIFFTSIYLGLFLSYAALMYLLTKDNPENFYRREIPKYIVALRNSFYPLMYLSISSILIITFDKYKKYKKLFSVLIILLIVSEMYRFGWKYTPFSPRKIVFPETPIIEFLKSQNGTYRTTGNKVIPMNMQMAYGIETTEGYDAVYSQLTAKYLAVLNDDSIEASTSGRYGFVNKENSHLLDLINTKYYVVLKDNLPKYSDPKFFEAFEDGSVVILESSKALNRAFMVYDWEVIHSEDETLERLLDPDFPIANKLVVAEMPSISRSNEENEDEIVYKNINANLTRINVKTNNEGLLFVSDAYYPGWQAFLDGKKVETIKANFAFRSVEIPSGGEHVVEFKYMPDSFQKGLLIAKISLLGLAALSYTLYVKYEK